MCTTTALLLILVLVIFNIKFRVYNFSLEKIKVQVEVYSNNIRIVVDKGSSYLYMLSLYTSLLYSKTRYKLEKVMLVVISC